MTVRPTPSADAGGASDAAPSAVRPPRVRRPPSTGGASATVTRLGPADTRPDPVPVSAVQGTLALDLYGWRSVPETPELQASPRPRLNLLEGGGSDATLHPWAARFAQAVVEVLGGDRPLPQLVRWTSDRVYSELGRRVRILGRSSPAHQRLRTVRPQVRSVHVFQPTAGSAEVSVHVRHGHRSRALAARLEHDEQGWRCTALQLG
jgi:hypothetical protein